MRFLQLPEIEPRAVQPVVSHYTDYNAYTFVNLTLDGEEWRTSNCEPVEIKESSNNQI